MKKFGEFILANIIVGFYFLAALVLCCVALCLLVTPIMLCFTDANINWCEYIMWVIICVGTFPAYVITMEGAIKQTKKRWNFKIIYPEDN